MYFVKLKNGRTLWVNEDRVRDLQQDKRLLYVIAENSRPSNGNGETISRKKKLKELER